MSAEAQAQGCSSSGEDRQPWRPVRGNGLESQGERGARCPLPGPAPGLCVTSGKPLSPWGAGSLVCCSDEVEKAPLSMAHYRSASLPWVLQAAGRYCAVATSPPPGFSAAEGQPGTECSTPGSEACRVGRRQEPRREQGHTGVCVWGGVGGRGEGQGTRLLQSPELGAPSC